MQPSEPDIRAFLMAEAFRFIDRATVLPGVIRIAVIGSLTTTKPSPKDVDILVTVDDDADLNALAAAARALKGVTQSKNKGADVFVANKSGRYIGRICHWRRCGPGIRASCDAHHCGQRHYLHDDFDDINLDPTIVSEPPIEVWPTVICRAEAPDDLLPHLVRFQSGRDES